MAAALAVGFGLAAGFTLAVGACALALRSGAPRDCCDRCDCRDCRDPCDPAVCADRPEREDTCVRVSDTGAIGRTPPAAPAEAAAAISSTVSPDGSPVSSDPSHIRRTPSAPRAMLYRHAASAAVTPCFT